MRRLIFIVLAVLSSLCGAAQEAGLVLTDKSIGKMPISPKMDISLSKIMKYFPYEKVTHEIRSGDSPDYHVYIVSTHQGEELISFISYIDSDKGYDKGVVELDELVIHSSSIKDEFGVSPGMAIATAEKLRKDLKFGAGHMDNYLGDGNIWYLFWVNGEHGTTVTREVAIAANPKIDIISWPKPRWR